MSSHPAREIALGALRLGAGNPLFLIAGPCVIESEAHACGMAEKIARIAHECGIPYIFKASYDKANRSSLKSFRGPGLTEGLRILKKVKKDFGVPVLTDIHESTQAAPAAEVCDILQIPAFLSRQTDLLVAAAKTSRIINVKKAQFLSPWDMSNVVEKIVGVGNEQIILTERGAAFAAHHQIGAQHHRACRMSRRLERIGIECGIGIEIMNARSRARRLHLVDVASGVNALELLPRCRRRLVMRDHSVEPGADQVIVDRIETLRALRMVRTHVVQATRRMRDVRDGHGKGEISLK